MTDSLDPRAARSRARIVDAAVALMSESGPESLTFAVVAERAGVGRATVYRHWPTVDALADEVMNEFSLPFFRDPREPLAAWLHQELRRLADELLTPTVVQLTTSLIRRDRTDVRRDRLFSVLEQRLQAAMTSLPLAPGASPPAERAAVLIGPLLYLALARGHEVSDDFIAHLVAGFLAPAA
ncbi:TetR family transcriptional regulator [Actinoplanes philippinensis]|uniref:DNA-binding transcriptional regulator, AcrR family n=1 Tax=Actinoplanes philippinensis TaxID=35752 RepID=A0A1I2G0R0_9ACTN|nr:TetR/AcrR family transcriptional regulator [Actinoplanes philippinensis]GIE76475.1 TetR family transcriptional regulator [Actinoplanes philippinensis]SFF10753.1 DNA-binding transcriptional regulator, AcrR family [Actinoplanes philippinensis]